jgi:hypothetical protein
MICTIKENPASTFYGLFFMCCAGLQGIEHRKW